MSPLLFELKTRSLIWSKPCARTPEKVTPNELRSMWQRACASAGPKLPSTMCACKFQGNVNTRSSSIRQRR